MANLQVILPSPSPSSDEHIIPSVSIFLRDFGHKSHAELLIELMRMHEELCVVRTHNQHLQEKINALSSSNSTPSELIRFGIIQKKDASTDTPNITNGESVETLVEDEPTPSIQDDAEPSSIVIEEQEVDEVINDSVHSNDRDDDSNGQYEVTVVCGYWNLHLEPIAKYLSETDQKIVVSKQGIVIVYKMPGNKRGDGNYYFIYISDRNNRLKISAYTNDIHIVKIRREALPENSITINEHPIDAIVSDIVEIRGHKVIEPMIVKNIPQDIIDAIDEGHNEFMGMVICININPDGYQYILLSTTFCGYENCRVYSTYRMSQLDPSVWDKLDYGQEFTGILDINRRDNSLIGKNLEIC